MFVIIYKTNCTIYLSRFQIKKHSEMSKFNEQIKRILWLLSTISILCYISYYFYESSTPIGILEYIWLMVKSIFFTILSLLILMPIIDFLSFLVEGTDESISFYLKEKLNFNSLDEGSKLGYLGIGYLMYLIILIINTPERFFEIYEFVETRNWIVFFIILIAGISIFINKLISPHKVVKFIAGWIFSIAILSVILFFSRPSYIDIYSIDELLWAVGCLGFISSLSILTAKAFE